MPLVGSLISQQSFYFILIRITQMVVLFFPFDLFSLIIQNLVLDYTGTNLFRFSNFLSSSFILFCVFFLTSISLVAFYCFIIVLYTFLLILLLLKIFTPNYLLWTNTSSMTATAGTAFVSIFPSFFLFIFISLNLLWFITNTVSYFL